MSVQYVVNGVASNWLKRMFGTKTFAVCAILVLGAAQQWNEGNISGAQFLQFCQVGVIGILLRAALAKAELAANASNPDVENVEAVETPGKPGGGTSGGGMSMGILFGVFAIALACVSFTGCSAGSKLGEVITNPDGKPIISGEICVNTANGRFCYVPNQPTIVEPEAKPNTVGAAAVAVAPMPGPVVPAAAPLTVAAPGRALEK